MNWKTHYNCPTKALLKSNNLIANVKMKQWEGDLKNMYTGKFLKPFLISLYTFGVSRLSYDIWKPQYIVYKEISGV